MRDRFMRPGSARSGLLLALTLFTGLAAYLDAGRQANTFLGDIELLLALVAAACALVGTWLVLRRMAMMADAIAHAILFGIVAMLWIGLRIGLAIDLASPSLILGAAGAGLLTVFLTESLLRTKLLREDAAIGMVFTFLFALALVIIASSFSDAHVDEHLVLAGGVENTVFRRLVLRDLDLPRWLSASIGGLIQALAPPEAVRVTADGAMRILRWNLGPRALWTMSLSFAAGASFVALFWKELKLSTFDAGLAASLGFAPVLLNYLLMGLVSVTAVGAFEAVGSIIVIALFIAPPAAAYLLTENLLEMQLLSVLLGLLSAIGGFHLGLRLDANFGGSVALVSGLIFGLVLIFAPQQGLLGQWLRRKRQREAFAVDMLLVHLAQHEGRPEEAEEADLAALPRHLRWSRQHCASVVQEARRDALAEIDGQTLRLTELGRDRAQDALARGGGSG